MGVRSALGLAGRLVNELLSFVVFCALDVLDVLLCFAYKLADYAKEAQWRPCYCSSSSAGDVVAGSGKILVSEGGGGGAKIVCSLRSSSKLQLEDISDTLFSRPSLVSDLSRRLRSASVKKMPAAAAATFTVNSTIVQMLRGKIGGLQSLPVPRWSDCDCKSCTAWTRPQTDKLFVHVENPTGGAAPEEEVLFIHGFISSSAFWTETVFPNFSQATKAKYRLTAVDLLGFGQSPKPTDSLYTLREHVDMIERSALADRRHNGGGAARPLHIVAHSLGSILALALAVRHPDAVKSLTLLAPPYFPVPRGEQGTQYVLRRVAPRRVWPPLAMGASLACWYEHISRTICLLICKNHRIWEFIFKFITRNRMKSFLLEGFFCHTHNAAWHTLHNIICGSAGKIDGYLDAIRDRIRCSVTVIHGRNDEVLPVECSVAVKSKIPRADIKIVENKDHITVIVTRQKAFARELEEIWNNANRD